MYGKSYHAAAEETAVRANNYAEPMADAPEPMEPDCLRAVIGAVNGASESLHGEISALERALSMILKMDPGTKESDCPRTSLSCELADRVYVANVAVQDAIKRIQSINRRLGL